MESPRHPMPTLTCERLSRRTATWQEKQPVITGLSHPIMQLSSDGRWLATEEQIRAGARHTIDHQRKVWNLATGMEMAWKETVTGNPLWCEFEPAQGRTAELDF